ncbi:VOC family protein [Halioxenophilus aromaticivorans]|uniref:VOC family protein n=1 Tax=Halioxenophilus aromaticivorans TaxID=1306992 RepID=A0AAV3U7M3_9ALTE
MEIVGLDCLVFGVEDTVACNEYLQDAGLIAQDVSESGGEFAALDGTSVMIRSVDDQNLPKPLATNSSLRKTIYGVADTATLQAVYDELSKDRSVERLADGSIETTDDSGFCLGFRVTVRKKLQLNGEKINSPGAIGGRAVNEIGADPDAGTPTPITLSHVVYFVPDVKKAESFYIDRLGFRVADRFTNLGPFLRPQGTLDHHCLFLIETPPEMQGVEHFTFHMAGPSELLRAGKQFQDKGYETFWGPGRHIFGSNYFWYFNSPMNVHFELDADMDLHDDNWQPRAVDAAKDTSQIFNFTLVENWQPGGDPH